MVSSFLRSNVQTQTPFTVDPLKDGVGNEHIFRNGSFRELKIAKESNDLSDLAKVLPESYQKSNEFSIHTYFI